jgi:DNA-binding MarR family transcriptional regulator
VKEDDFIMLPLMHQFLMEKVEWYEASLQAQAHALGYQHISQSLVQLIKNMNPNGPSRIVDLAACLGVTRRRVSQIVAIGVEEKLLETEPDPEDGRAVLVSLSVHGQIMVDAAVASMIRIEAELRHRIGEKTLDTLTTILKANWGDIIATQTPDNATICEAQS